MYGAMLLVSMIAKLLQVTFLIASFSNPDATQWTYYFALASLKRCYLAHTVQPESVLYVLYENVIVKMVYHCRYNTCIKNRVRYVSIYLLSTYCL
jgi:hypothetical protein